MCGIAGFFNTGYARTDLEKMTDRLTHRGPDAKGYYYNREEGIGLGHRRLSILDLSEAGNQPFYSRDDRYVMVFNGEVYNFREIASKFNIKPLSHSDTEIIIELFALKGIGAINELNGMFALAIWDKQDKKLFLVRDRIGIKPIYYYVADNKVLFASELKAIEFFPQKKEINHDSVYHFLHLGYIPGSETIYRNYYKLKPGQYAVVDKNGIEVQSYWKVEDSILPESLRDEQSALAKLSELVKSSVEYCMISDVPLGIFLSGGVDSSLVAATAQSLSTQSIKTFSIGFKEAKFNESAYARRVANHIHSDHHEFTVTEQEAIELVDSLLDAYDEPYADSSAIPTMMVSKLARSQVTVALSGDGGDELFMGYGFYYWARRLQNPLISAFRKPIASILNSSGKSRLERAAKMFEYPSAGRRKSHIFSQEQYYFSEAELDKFLIKPAHSELDECIDMRTRRMSWAEEQSIFDIKNYLPEDLLVKTDRASMKYGLEVRVPLLDHRITEFAVNLDENLKLRNGTGKYLLKQVLYQYVPKEIFDRPKWGFAVPLSKWLRTDLNFLFDKYLNKEVISEAGFIKPAIAEELKTRFLTGKDFLHTRLWALILLHKWYKEKRS